MKTLNPSSFPFQFVALNILLLPICISLQAQVHFTNPVRITQKEGLPDNLVLCIAQDGEGFMWFGTNEGLCRFDGSVVSVFQNVPGDSTSLSDNRVRSLLYDNETNCLWMGTSNGLNVLNLHSGKFRAYFHHPEDPHSITDNDFGSAIFKDRQGVIWIGLGRQGIIRYNRARDNFDRFNYHLSSSDIGERLDRINFIFRIAQDVRNDSILWIGTGSGLLEFNKYKERFIRSAADLGDKRLNISINSTCCMYLHPDGRIFLGAWGGFLNIFDPIRKSFRQVNPTLDTLRFPRGNGVVLEILEKSKNELWITTEQGLAVYDIEKDAITSELLNDPDNNTVFRASYQDKSKRVWGRSASGIRIYDPINQQFQLYPVKKEADARFYPMTVLDAPVKGQLYVNVAGGKGLYLLDRKTGKWSLIPAPASFFESYSEFAGRDMIFLEDGRLLVVEESTLFTLSDDGKSLVQFPLQPKGKGARFMLVVQDHQERIWITSVDGGLFRLDLNSGTSLVFSDELLDDTQKGQPFTLGSIFKDSHQNIWIDVKEGFSVYDNSKDTFINFPFYPGSRNTFRHISGFAEDNQGNILVGGAREDGIGIADPNQLEKGILRKLSVQNDRSYYPNGMMKDGEGNLWMNDEKNLIRIDLHMLDLSRFDGHDGLDFKDQNPETIEIDNLNLLQSEEIAICYGRQGGIGIFHPHSLRKNTELPRPYLISFAVFDKKIDSDTTPFYQKNITLPFSQNFFSFEFSAISFTQPHKNIFKYKLEGLDPDWVFPTAGRRYASYSNVKEGKYTLRIMAANNEGTWNEEGFQMAILVLPPWYRSWWAYLLYILAFTGVSIIIYRFLKNRWALKAELELEHLESLRLKELDTFKTRLYTNITHEFRTPLTVISGMADEMKLEIGTSKIHDSKSSISQFTSVNLRFLMSSLDMIKRNSGHLLRLVNQMLDLQKLEAGKMSLNMVQGDVLIYLKYLVESFHSQAAAKNIDLHFETELTEMIMDYDPDKLPQIVSNLLSNAIKFTPEGGNVILDIGILGYPDIESRTANIPISQYPNICISVSDNGIGIPPEKQPFVFDRFYQADNTHTRQSEGTGIGLALAKELVKFLGGELSVKSEPGMGTTFSVLLPVSHQAAFAAGIGDDEMENQGAGLAPVPMLPGENIALKNNSLPQVLLIEDNPDVQQYLSVCLENEYRVLLAGNGQDGIEKAIELVPDLVISDVMMPEKDGFKVCQTLKNDERTSHIPIILLTAKADMESRLEGLTSGADAYLAKPFNKNELLIRTEKLLELRQHLQQHYLSIATGQQGPAAEKQLPDDEKKEDIFVQKIREIVSDHLSDGHFSVDELSKEVAMSRSQTHRKLTALTGISPNRFIRFMRLQKASQLLLETDDNVADIAYDTGFNDPAYFARVFSQEFGMTPSDYRESKSVSN